MQRFFFDLTDGERTIRDEIGVEAPGRDVALDQAESVISEIAGQNESPERDNVWELVVRDQAGAIVARLPLPRSCED